MTIKSFRELQVWKKADELAHRVFDLTDTFPRNYLFDLTGQLRRAALSIPTNLAEGCATAHTKELLQFINIARRSVSETLYLLLFAFRRALIAPQEHAHIVASYEEIQRMLSGLTSAIRGTAARNKPHRALLPSGLALLAFFTSHSSLVTSHLPTAWAQSTNGSVTVTQETMVAGGGRVGGGNPMNLVTALGEPLGGAATNGGILLRLGSQGSLPPLPPGTTAITIEGSVNKPLASVEVNGVPATVSGATFRAEGIRLVEGPNLITTIASDPAGHRATVHLTVHLDTHPPARPTVVAPGVLSQATGQALGGTKTPGTSIWVAVNGGAWIEAVAQNGETTWAATLPGLREGDNVVRIAAKDEAGNLSTSATVDLLVDQWPPVVAWQPVAKTNFNPIRVTGSVDDRLTTVTINGARASRAGLAFEADVPLALGPNTVRLVAVSPNGHVTDASAAVTLGTVPAIQSVQPPDGALLEVGALADLRVGATDRENDPIAYQILIDGAPISPWGPSASATWTPGLSQRGLRRIEMRARDDFGGMASQPLEVFVVRKAVTP